MNKYELSNAESDVLAEVKDLIKTLAPQSQYKVLRNLAHLMDREVVRPGAVRAAAAVAGSTAAAKRDALGAKSASKGQVRPKKKAAGFSQLYLGTEQGKALLSRRNELRELIKGVPPTEEQKRSLRELSSLLREGNQAFLDSQEIA